MGAAFPRDSRWLCPNGDLEHARLISSHHPVTSCEINPRGAIAQWSNSLPNTLCLDDNHRASTSPCPADWILDLASGEVAGKHS